METMKRLEEDIKENIKVYIIMQKEKLYKDFAQNNLLIKRNILFESIVYAKINEDTNNPKEIYDNYLKEDNNEISILPNVPDSFIAEFLNYIDIVLEENKEAFYIEPLQIGRYDLLFKGVLHYIKLLNSNLKNQKITLPPEITNFIQTMSLKDAVELYFDKMIDNAITFCKCYEADSTNNKMCIEVLNKGFTEHYKYQYKLDKLTTERLQEDIKLIVTNLENKTEYTKNMNGHVDVSMIHLLDTIGYAQKFINDMIHNDKDLKSKEFAGVIKTFEQIFKNCKNRFKNSKKTTGFLTALKEANMFHRMPYKNKIIYPFVYDLIVIGFMYSVNHLKNKEIYTDSNLFVKACNDTKYKYLDKEDDDSYRFDELKTLVAEIPQEFKVLDESMILIIKHYSEFLDCEYKEVANVLNQLRFESTSHKPNHYNLLQEQQGIKLCLGDDYFRRLSLYII